MTEAKPIILFDGVCNLCSKSVQRVLKNERSSLHLFASLQSDYGRKKVEEFGGDPDKVDSIVLIQNGKVYYKSRAVMRIAAKMKFPYPLVYFFWPIPYFARDWIYVWIANNRYKWYGKLEECWLPSPEFKERFLD